MKNIITIFFCFSSIVVSQEYGLRIGMTTATPTGNYDSYDFDFLKSFTPGYKVGFFGKFILSDVIIVKPEITYREYSVRQIIEIISNEADEIIQTHNAISSDLNFDVRLSDNISLIFGLGIDYVMFIKSSVNKKQSFNKIDLSGLKNNDRVNPFNNIGLCFKLGRSVLIDLEYRHLLENFSLGDITNNELISLEQGGVKLHMINFSIGILF